VKNNFAAGEYRKLSGNMAILHQLIQFDGEGDWHAINEAGPKIQAVTAADVKRVANAYFTKDNRAVATYTRRPAKPGADSDELTGVPDEMKPMAKQMLARVKAETNAGQLKQMLAQIEEHAGQADEKEKPLMNLMRKQLNERIAELEKK
jgi:hypothetical protein